MKKKLMLCFSLAFIAATLASCGGITPKSSESESIPEEVSIELDSEYSCKLRLLIPQGNSNETTMIDNCISGFNELFPNITFEKSYVSVNNWESTVRNQNLAGTLPDIVWSSSPDFYYLVSAKIAEPLDPYYSAAEKAGVFNLKEDFIMNFIDMGSMNDVHYLLPRSCDTVVTFYNKKLLTQAGIDISVIKDGWTWETFTDVMAQYRTYLDSKGKSDWYCCDANLTTWLSCNYPILRSYGADVLTKAGEIAIDSQETRECLTMIKSLMENKYIVEEGVTPGNSFEVGTAPFLFQSASISLFAERRELKGNIDLASFPLINAKSAPKIGSGIAGYAINRKSKEKVAAWQFLNYMMSREGQEKLAEGGLRLPSIRKDLQDYKTSKWGEGYTDYNLAAYTYGPEYKVVPEFLSYVDPKIKGDLDLAFKDLFANTLKRSKTIEKAIETCVMDLEDALAKL